MIESSIFPVKEVPATFIEPGNQFQHSTGYKFIVREDTNDVLSCMTNTYKLLSNQEVVDKTAPVVKEAGGILEDVKMFGNGARTMWKFKFPDIKVKIADKDYVNPTITVQNSYDGSTEGSVLSGAYRLICSNGMIIGYTLSRKSNRHIIWNESLSDMDKIVNDAIDGIKTVFDEDFPTLIETKVKQSHVARLLTMFPLTVNDSLTQYLIGKPPKTYWDLLNAATWTNTHAMNRKNESTHKLERTIYPKIKGWASATALENVARA